MLAAMFGLFVLATRRFRLGVVELTPAILIAFLVFYAIGIMLLVITVYQDGQLVHEFGL